MPEVTKTEVELKNKLKLNFLSQNQFEHADKNPNELYYTPDTTESDIASALASHNNDTSAHPSILSDLEHKISKYDSLPVADDHAGEIVQYTGLTNPSTGYTHAFFYKSVLTHHESEVLQIAGTSSSTLMPNDITIDAPTWRNKVNVSGVYVFTYDGTDWSLDNTVVDLSEYGLTIDPGVTVSDNDNFEVAYEPEVNVYEWVQQNVQPEGLGTITDVQIHGISKVTNHVANLSVLEQVSDMTSWTASSILVGRIIQYTGTTTQDYIHNYFYECIEIPGERYVENDELMDKEGLTKVELNEPLLDSVLEDIIDQGTGGYTYINGVEVGFMSQQIVPIGDGSLGLSFSSLEQLASSYGIIVEGTPTSNTYLAWTIDDDPQPTYKWVAIIEPISSEEINALWE